jgi:hypothetical protein
MKSILLLALAIGAASAQAANSPKVWGQVICQAVAQSDAVAYAQSNHFLDNWDPDKDPNPPYVAPVGTLDCSLPIQVTKETNDNGTFYYIQVKTQGAPSPIGNCKIIYYNGTPTRTFHADGEGNGYLGMVGSDSDFTPFFDDNDQTQYTYDQFMIDGVGTTPTINWSGEIRDDKPHIPILSNCNITFPGDSAIR